MRPNLPSIACAILVSALFLACSKDHPTDEGGMLAPSASAGSMPVADQGGMLPVDGGASAATTASATASAAASTSAAPAASGSSAAAATCGSKTDPCPLQKWMKDHTQMDLSAGDLTALATDLDKIATMAPPGYTKWASISKDGATAARAANTDGAKASCRGCHDAYKTKYKTEMRTRAVP